MRFLPSTISAVLIAASAISPALADVRCGGSGAVRVGVAPPPPLPEADQPPMPAYGYVWTPGSWAWNPDINDYYWTAGAWILPPAIGLFWTPGFWGWDDGYYLYHAGYWGSHVGFYGGVRYGFGYWGHGYDGGYWRGRTFYYNRAYNNIGALRINALYEHRDPGERLGGRTSFSGGPGGVVAGERADERLADRDAHIASTADQLRHTQRAASDPMMRAGVNHGHLLQTRAALGAPGHPAVGHVESNHSWTGHVATTRVAAHYRAPSHTVYAPSAFRHAAADQPRHDAVHGHYGPTYRAPNYAPSQPFRGEPQRWGPPRSEPVHQGIPRGQQGEHPRQGGERPQR